MVQSPTIAPPRPRPTIPAPAAPPAPPAPATPPAPTPVLPERGFSVVGQSVPRLDGYAKVTGQAQYASDVVLPRMAYAKLVRSPYAHARIRSLDASAALQRPGVIAVLTGDDVAKLPNPRYGHAIADHPVLAIDTVRFAGEPVAAVIAEDERTAQEATADVEVEYEELEPVLDVLQATAPGATLVHETRYSEGQFSGTTYFEGAGEEERAEPMPNVAHHTRLEWGDADAAFARAASIVENTYVFPLAYGYAMEPYVAVAEYRQGSLTVYSSAQHPYMVRHDLAKVFDLPLSRVRVVVPYIGGGYGTKSYTKIEPLVAACAQKAGRPVKLQLTVEEAIFTTRVAGATMRVRTGADEHGHVVAREATLLFDGGAYAENGPHGAYLAPRSVVGPYHVPNVRVDSYLVYTNTAPSSSYRGFSSTQPTFAAEAQNDELAEQVGKDPLQFRLENLVAFGEHINDPDTRPLDGDLKGDLEKAARAVGWGRPGQPGTGRGLALMALTAGAFPVSTAEVRVHGDGSVSVLTGTTELGQGSETIMAQIAAEELGVPLSAINVVRSDTGTTPFERSTGASRSTTLQGRALLEACRNARVRLRQMAAEFLDASPDDLAPTEGGFSHDGKSYSYADILTRYFGMADVEAIGLGHTRKVGDLKAWPVFWELSAVGLGVAVDEETGQVRVNQLATVGDVGVAINPAMTEGQDLGAAVQGVGPALFEELVYDGQQLSNGSLLFYRVPRFSDVPRHPRMMLTENRDGAGPYGAKGSGEGAISPIAPAIANALFDATGVRFRHLPLTPEKVWRTLRDQRREPDHPTPPSS